MAVEPVELQRIAADRVGAGGLGGRRVHLERIGGPGFGLAGFAPLLFALLDTGGARAGLAQPGKGPLAAMAILPVDFKALALGEQDAHLLRSDGDAVEGKDLLFRLLALLNEANALVAHKDILVDSAQ